MISESETTLPQFKFGRVSDSACIIVAVRYLRGLELGPDAEIIRDLMLAGF